MAKNDLPNECRENKELQKAYKYKKRNDIKYPETYTISCCAYNAQNDDGSKKCNVYFIVRIYEDETTVEIKGQEHGNEEIESYAFLNSRRCDAELIIKNEIEKIGCENVIGKEIKEIVQQMQNVNYNLLYKHKDIYKKFSLKEYLWKLQELNKGMIIQSEWKSTTVEKEVKCKRKYIKKENIDDSDMNCLEQLTKLFDESQEEEYENLRVVQLQGLPEVEYDVSSESFHFYSDDEISEKENQNDQTTEQKENKETIDELQSLSIIFPVIESIKNGSLQPIIMIDGCFHKKKKCVIISAVTVDCDHNEILVGTSLCTSESEKGWAVLLEPLLNNLKDVNLTLISDMSKGLLAFLKHNENKYINCHHMFCCLHVFNSIVNKLKIEFSFLFSNSKKFFLKHFIPICKERNMEKTIILIKEFALELEKEIANEISDENKAIKISQKIKKKEERKQKKNDLMKDLIMSFEKKKDMEGKRIELKKFEEGSIAHKIAVIINSKVPNKFMASCFQKEERRYGFTCSSVAESFNSTIVKDRYSDFNVLIFSLVQKQINIIERMNVKYNSLKGENYIGKQIDETERVKTFKGNVLVSDIEKNVVSLYPKNNTNNTATSPIATVDFDNFTCSCCYPNDYGSPCSHMLYVKVRRHEKEFLNKVPKYFISPDGYSYAKTPLVNVNIVDLGDNSKERYVFDDKGKLKRYQRIPSLFKDEERLSKWNNYSKTFDFV